MMKHPRLKKEYAGCYTYTGNEHVYRISETYDTGVHRRVWRVMYKPGTVFRLRFKAISLREAVKILDEVDGGDNNERDNQH